MWIKLNEIQKRREDNEKRESCHVGVRIARWNVVTRA